MKNLFKAIFSQDDKPETRRLTHPRELTTGDIIKFQYLPQNELSNKQFEISNINTYDFEDRKLTEFVLRGDTPEMIYLTVDETGDEAFLSVSRKISRADVEQLFDLDEFAELFDSEDHTQLNRQNEPEHLKSWTTAHYQQEIYAEVGYFHKGDFRASGVPEDEDAGDEFEYYLAIDSTRTFVIEAEVYDGGETDVIVTIRRPITDIEEMWPGSPPIAN
ncbi:MAG TPA: hypothetical protein ENK06_03885 [Gammaproteobacteria bacterium]|nr:hypothetical protein [Gammaproteobacteria bacterium]